jgi:hypothetical protein
MRRRYHTGAVKKGFEDTGRRIAIADIRPLRLVSDIVRRTRKYAQIPASIREVGIIEPPVVARDRDEADKYILLDGHLRLEILKETGATEVVCLVSTDDEAFTYNKRINRLAIVQEHRMILKAIERGVAEERIARALDVDIASIKRKRRLLEGICPEAVDLLKDRHIAIHAFTELKKLAPIRQIEAAELMIAMNKYTISYAKSLVAATPQSQLAHSFRPKVIKGLSGEQTALMERESAGLEREFRIAEQAYGTDHLDLVLANGYLGKLLGNARVVRYLSQHHSEILNEFQKLVELEANVA